MVNIGNAPNAGGSLICFAPNRQMNGSMGTIVRLTMTMSEETQDVVAMLAEWLNEHGLTADLVTSSPDESTIIVEIDTDYVAEWSMGT